VNTSTALIDSPLTSLRPASAAADSADFRSALRAFSTGVTVVTSAGGEAACGVTVNSFTSVSLAPPLVLVCLNVASSAAREIARNNAFAVNVLSSEQEALSRRFASPARPRGDGAFGDVAHHVGPTRAPLLDGVACWFDCRLSAVHLAGDHVILIGEVIDFDCDSSREPLVFHAGRYRVVRDCDRRATSSASPVSSRLVLHASLRPRGGESK